MVVIPNISISNRGAGSTRDYYAMISRRYGFADSEMRGHGSGLIPIKPVGEYIEHATADTYIVGDRPGRAAVGRLRDPAVTRRVADRAAEASDLIRQLRDLHSHLRRRLASRPSAAVRDALDDAETILRGGDPVAMGRGRLDVMRSLVRVLARHA